MDRPTTSYRAVPVWAGIVRLTHWINAIGILLLLAIGSVVALHEWLHVPDARVDQLIDIHAAIGFMVAASLLARIAYLLTGEGTGHWRDMVPHTKAQFRLAVDTVRYYLGGFKGECPLYFAHNPFAGIAYTGFFILALLQISTGAVMYLLGDASTQAYAHTLHDAGADKWPPEWLMDLHGITALLIAAFIGAHLSALALHDIVERRGLASSMISGYKFFTDEELERLPEVQKPAEESKHGDTG